MKLSVLMSVYCKESPFFLRQSLDSLVAQSLPADEVVIVEDGPLGEELEAAIDSYRSLLPIVSLRLPVNGGLGAALREGLQVCRGEFVARMDSDDSPAGQISSADGFSGTQSECGCGKRHLG